MYTYKEIKRINNMKTDLIKRGRGFAIDMITMMERRAAKDEEYRISFKAWLNGKGSTILLRDVLCAPFKNSSPVKHLTCRLPFDNMWMAVDSSHLHTRNTMAP